MDERSAVELVLDARAKVAEGPLWRSDDRTLFWVEIMGRRVHQYDPASGRDRSWEVGQPVGAAALRAAGGLVLALERGFGQLDLENGQVELIAPVETDEPGNRMNDGKCDPAGRFWAGTMAYDWQRRAGAGALYRLDPDGRVERMLGGVTLSNGLDWSPDGRQMYYVDTPTRRIDVFDFDLERGRIANRRPFVELGPEDGFPDGLTVDAEGFVWVALYQGWSVRRYAPDGSLAQTVQLPVAQVTACAFGGTDLGDLYITTASERFTADDFRREPHAGGLFRCRPGVVGRPPGRFAG